MKTKYYNYYPRNFGNEYTTIRVRTADEEKQLMDWYDNLRNPENHRLERVTVKQLRAMASNERHARRYDQAFSGYCTPWDPVSVAEFLRPAY